MSRTTENSTVLRLAEHLAAVPVGAIVSHAALRELVGEDLADQHWQFTNRALKLLNREGGRVFATIKGEGYRRLATEEGVNYVGAKGIRRTRAAAGQTLMLLGSALRHGNDITADAVKLANQRLAAAGLILHLTKAITIKHLPDAPQPKPDPLDGLRAALGL